MKQEKEIPSFYPSDKRQWRQWLQDNHHTERAVWLVRYKAKSGVPTVSWSDAVDEALCFGWIDSKAKPVDDEKFIQFFCRRKAGGTWSKVNKEKVRRLTEEGCMTAAGLAVIEAAKHNGSWTILDDVEELLVPDDLERAFSAFPGSKDFFLGLSKSVKKSILQWIVLARRAETRQKRIAETAALAAEKRRPKHI